MFGRTYSKKDEVIFPGKAHDYNTVDFLQYNPPFTPTPVENLRLRKFLWASLRQ